MLVGFESTSSYMNSERKGLILDVDNHSQAGLFIYDIFWVFFTPVMVSVAKSFDAPIKVLLAFLCFSVVFEVVECGIVTLFILRVQV